MISHRADLLHKLREKNRETCFIHIVVYESQNMGESIAGFVTDASGNNIASNPKVKIFNQTLSYLLTQRNRSWDVTFYDELSFNPNNPSFNHTSAVNNLNFATVDEMAKQMQLAIPYYYKGHKMHVNEADSAFCDMEVFIPRFFLLESVAFEGKDWTVEEYNGNGDYRLRSADGEYRLNVKESDL